MAPFWVSLATKRLVRNEKMEYTKAIIRSSTAILTKVWKKTTVEDPKLLTSINSSWQFESSYFCKKKPQQLQIFIQYSLPCSQLWRLLNFLCLPFVIVFPFWGRVHPSDWLIDGHLLIMNLDSRCVSWGVWKSPSYLFFYWEGLFWDRFIPPACESNFRCPCQKVFQRWSISEGLSLCKLL